MIHVNGNAIFDFIVVDASLGAPGAPQLWSIEPASQ